MQKHSLRPINSSSKKSDYSRSSTSNGSQSDFIHSVKSSEVKDSQGFIGSFIGCFVPHKSTEEDDDDSGNVPTVDSLSSYSGSRTSTRSSSSQSRATKFSSSYTVSDAKGSTEFSIPILCKATKNFSAENIIGEGGFGTVYKGKLKDGTLISVKRAKKNLLQHLSSEFKTEIQIFSRIDHLNLVKFLGFIEQDDERLIVVEYVGNGNLREHLDGIHGGVLELAARLDIAIDVAHAITYLHMYTDHPIIHRDIKASNILITENFRAKVSDFGFARLMSDDPDATHVSTQVRGTAGYLDPEYLSTYQLTEKSDVYSFGVLLVEMVTGRRPIDRNRNVNERRAVVWAIQKLKEGEAVVAMDPRLRRSPASVTAIEKMLKLAAACTATSRKSRPSMNKCAEVLWRIRKDYGDMQPIQK